MRQKLTKVLTNKVYKNIKISLHIYAPRETFVLLAHKKQGNLACLLCCFKKL